MNVLAVILIIALGCLVTWLLIDTVIALVRRYKHKKNNKEIKEDKVD